MKKHFFSLWVIRFAAVALVFVSLKFAWAGVWIYRGERAFRQKDFPRALSNFEKAELWDRQNPHLLDLLGQSAWQLGTQKKDRRLFEKAKEIFGKFSGKLPYYGRAKLYLALNRIALGEKSSAEWSEIEALLEAAYQDETGSPWMAYMMARTLLSEAPALSEEKKSAMIDRLKKSISFHYPGNPSPYLEPGLHFLWKKFSDFDLLKEVTPRDAFSYYVLIQMIEKNGLWEYREGVERDFFDLTRDAYSEQLKKGEKLLKDRRFSGALPEFQKAFWIDKTSLRARAGMLVSQAELNQLPGDYQAQLREILAEKEEDLSKFVRLLEPLIQKSGNPDLKELHTSGGKKSGEVIEITRHGNADDWWGWGNGVKDLRFRLDQRARMGISLNLKPGRVLIKIALRSMPDTKRKYGYLLFRLMNETKERRVAVVYVSHQQWQDTVIQLETAGGKRWLEAELLNGREDPKASRGPIVEFGAVTIEYPDEN